MRWRKHEKKAIPEGTERVAYRFLILPTCINGGYRWLEFANMLQVYTYGMRGKYWINDRFLTKEEAKHYKK